MLLREVEEEEDRSEPAAERKNAARVWSRLPTPCYAFAPIRDSKTLGLRGEP